MNRRSFLQGLAATAGALLLPTGELWTPGKRAIFDMGRAARPRLDVDLVAFYRLVDDDRGVHFLEQTPRADGSFVVPLNAMSMRVEARNRGSRPATFRSALGDMRFGMATFVEGGLVEPGHVVSMEMPLFLGDPKMEVQVWKAWPDERTSKVRGADEAEWST